jgi:cell division protein FtsW
MAKRVGADKWLFFTTLLLTVAGLVMVFSASAIVAQERFHSPYSLLLKQTVYAFVGFLALVVLMHIDYSTYNSPRFIYPALSVTTLLLIAVFFFPGVNGTHRWIRFGGYFNLEPSELAKPVLVLFLAWFLQTRLDAMRNLKKTLLRAAIIPVVLMVLVVRQPDLGTALVLAGVTGIMLMLAGMEWKYLLGAIGVALPFLAALLLLVPWRRARMLVFLHPLSDPMGAGYHITQSLIAVGTGGLVGRGYMEGMQKLFYLPESATDFIFANITEELGFIGAMVIVGLFLVLAVRGFRAAFRSQDAFGRLVAFGITATILLQAFFNISVVLSLVPAKGIPLPLTSYGGTSMICTLASIGILLNITKKTD